MLHASGQILLSLLWSKHPVNFLGYENRIHQLPNTCSPDQQSLVFLWYGKTKAEVLVWGCKRADSQGGQGLGISKGRGCAIATCSHGIWRPWWRSRYCTCAFPARGDRGEILEQEVDSQKVMNVPLGWSLRRLASLSTEGKHNPHF